MMEDIQWFTFFVNAMWFFVIKHNHFFFREGCVPRVEKQQPHSNPAEGYQMGDGVICITRFITSGVIIQYQKKKEKTTC